MRLALFIKVQNYGTNIFSDDVQKSDTISLFKQAVGKTYKSFDKHCLI